MRAQASRNTSSPIPVAAGCNLLEDRRQHREVAPSCPARWTSPTVWAETPRTARGRFAVTIARGSSTDRWRIRRKMHAIGPHRQSHVNVRVDEQPGGGRVQRGSDVQSFTGHELQVGWVQIFFAELDVVHPARAASAMQRSKRGSLVGITAGEAQRSVM